MASFSVEKTDALHWAIYNKDAKEVERALDDPEVDVNSLNRGTPAFVYACHVSHVETIKLFLVCKRDIEYNATDVGGWTALRFALRNPAATQLLLDDPRVGVCCSYIENLSITLYDYLDSVKVFMAHDRFDASILSKRMEFTGRTLAEESIHKNRHTAAELYEAYANDPIGTKARLRSEQGYPCSLAGELFAIVVLLCDDYLKIEI